MTHSHTYVRESHYYYYTLLSQVSCSVHQNRWGKIPLKNFVETKFTKDAAAAILTGSSWCSFSWLNIASNTSLWFVLLVPACCWPGWNSSEPQEERGSVELSTNRLTQHIIWRSIMHRREEACWGLTNQDVCEPKVSPTAAEKNMRCRCCRSKRPEKA